MSVEWISRVVQLLVDDDLFLVVSAFAFAALLLSIRSQCLLFVLTGGRTTIERAKGLLLFDALPFVCSTGFRVSQKCMMESEARERGSTKEGATNHTFYWTYASAAEMNQCSVLTETSQRNTRKQQGKERNRDAITN